LKRKRNLKVPVCYVKARNYKREYSIYLHLLYYMLNCSFTWYNWNYWYRGASSWFCCYTGS